MKRLVVVVVALTVVAGALAYAQSAREGNYPSNDAVNEGGLYQASFCANQSWIGNGAYANNFNMRVTKQLNRGWFEADVASSLDAKTGKLILPVDTVRINQALLCYVRPITR